MRPPITVETATCFANASRFPRPTESAGPRSRNNSFSDAGLDPWVPCEKSRIVELRAFTVSARWSSSGEMDRGQFTSKQDTWLVGVDTAKAPGCGYSGGTISQYRMLDVRILRTASHWEVWIFRRGQPLRSAGSIGLMLASDALRQGQDLVDDLLNDALKQLDALLKSTAPQPR